MRTFSLAILSFFVTISVGCSAKPEYDRISYDQAEVKLEYGTVLDFGFPDTVGTAAEIINFSFGGMETPPAQTTPTYKTKMDSGKITYLTYWGRNGEVLLRGDRVCIATDRYNRQSIVRPVKPRRY